MPDIYETEADLVESERWHEREEARKQRRRTNELLEEQNRLLRKCVEEKTKREE